MRVLIVLEVLILVASAGAAWDLLGANAWDRPAPFDLLADRKGGIDPARFVLDDPAERAARGERDRELGVALSGYDEILDRRPNDPDARIGRLRATLRLGGAAVGQTGLNELVLEQMKDYVDHVEELDPDGALLRPMLREWCDLRLQSPMLYNKASVAIWLAARGDEAGAERMRAFVQMGPFHHEFFPYAEKFHPGWRAAEPIIRHYLTQGDLLGRVVAGATLLEYHYLYGVGADLYQQHLPAIRAAFKEIKGKIGARQRQGIVHATGAGAIFAMGILALHGFEEEKRVLADMTFLAYPHHADTIRMARIMAGLRPFKDYRPDTETYKLLPISSRELYFRAVAHHSALLDRQGATGARREELDTLLDYGFHSGDGLADLICWRALAARDPAWTQRALERRNLYATVVLLDRFGWVERVRRIGMFLASPQPDYAALAAVSLLDLDEACAVMDPSRG